MPKPVPTPVPSPTPVPPPSPTPSPSPFTPGDCFSADADQHTCESTADVKTGKRCHWCGADSFLACVTEDWGCNSVSV
jgi:hypothetical protein